MNTYSLEGLRACINYAKALIESEHHFSIESVTLTPTKATLYFSEGGGWIEHYTELGDKEKAKQRRESHSIEVEEVIYHLETWYPKGLTLSAREVMNSLI